MRQRYVKLVTDKDDELSIMKLSPEDYADYFAKVWPSLKLEDLMQRKTFITEMALVLQIRVASSFLFLHHGPKAKVADSACSAVLPLSRRQGRTCGGEFCLTRGRLLSIQIYV